MGHSIVLKGPVKRSSQPHLQSHTAVHSFQLWTPSCLWSPIATTLLYAFLPLLTHPLPRMHFSPFLAWLTLCTPQGSAQHHSFQEMFPEAPDEARDPFWVFSQSLFASIIYYCYVILTSSSYISVCHTRHLS